MTARWWLSAFVPLAMASAEEIPKAARVAEAPAAAETNTPDRVISSTRQFRVTGGQPGDRALVAMIAEEAKAEFQQLSAEDVALAPKTFGAPNAFAPKEAAPVPVTITLHGKPGDPPPARTIATSIQVSETGYSVRLDIHLCRGVEKDRLIDAITSAMVLTSSLQGRPTTAADVPFQVAPWLVEGVREAIDWQHDRSDRRPYEAMFKSGGMFKPEQLFGAGDAEVADMDSATRLAFRVSSGALVMALLQQPQGKEGFRSFLTEVAPFQGEMPALLRKHFPGMNLSLTSLEKWWALQMANIGGQSLTTDVLPVADTEIALAEALRLDVRGEAGIVERKDLTAWPEVVKLPQEARLAAIKLSREELNRLSFRCFPSFRPIISEYQTILSTIAANKTKNLASRLEDLAGRRTTMTAKAQRARDYLDWFEISRARETSGAFDDYMRLKDRLKANPHRRSDNLSKYLDRMDAIFGRASTPPPRGARPAVEAPPGTDFLPEPPPLPNR